MKPTSRVPPWKAGPGRSTRVDGRPLNSRTAPSPSRVIRVATATRGADVDGERRCQRRRRGRAAGRMPCAPTAEARMMGRSRAVTLPHPAAGRRGTPSPPLPPLPTVGRGVARGAGVGDHGRHRCPNTASTGRERSPPLYYGTPDPLEGDRPGQRQGDTSADPDATRGFPGGDPHNAILTAQRIIQPGYDTGWTATRPSSRRTL